MYTIKQFTSTDVKAKNRNCPGAIVNGCTYIVTRYKVDASDDMVPEAFEQSDIAALGTEEEAKAYCVTAYARELCISSAIQYFYRVRVMEVE